MHSYFSNFVPFLPSGNSISAGCARGNQGSRRAVKIVRCIQRRRASPAARDGAGREGVWGSLRQGGGAGVLRVPSPRAGPGQGRPRARLCRCLLPGAAAARRRGLAALPPFSVPSVCLFCSVYGYPPGYLRTRIKDSSVLSRETSSALPRLSPPGARSRPGRRDRRSAAGSAASCGSAFNSFLAEFPAREETAAGLAQLAHSITAERALETSQDCFKRRVNRGDCRRRNLKK